MLSPTPMSFKPNPPEPASLPALTGFGVVEARGPDAAAFLQAQTMNDVAALAAGHWHWNGLLTPKGRVIALFALARLAADRFLLVLPDVPADEFAAALRRFVFRRKVVLDHETGLVATAGPAPADGLPPDALREDGARVVLDWSGDAARRALWLLPAGDPALAPAGAGSDHAWTRADLAHGLPRLPASQREAWTPQMLSLERLGAFSLSKGCYPGQEIVARTHYLGQAKRGLARLRGEGLSAGLELRSGDTPVGTVACALPDGSEALAIVSADCPATLSSDAGDCLREPLAGGLRRPA